MKYSENELELKKPNKLQYEAFDLTAPISEETVVFPGDPKFKSQKISHLRG